MGVYVKTNGSLKPIKNKVTSTEIEEALGYTPANPDDIDIPDVDIDLSDIESDDNTFYVVDKNGKIIFKIDKDGIHTNKFATEVSFGSEGENELLVKEHLKDAFVEDTPKHHVSAADRKRWNENTAGTNEGISNIENKIDTHIEDFDKHLKDFDLHKTAEENAAIDAADEGTTFAIVDENGYKIAEIDGDGLHAFNVIIGKVGEQQSVKEMIDEAIDAIEIPEVDLSNYYTKDKTYSKTEVDGMIPSLEGYAKTSDHYTKTEADAAFMTQDEVDGRINTLIEAADPEDGKTITNIQNLVKYVDENAGEIAGLVSDVQKNAQDIANMGEEIVSEQQEFHIVDENGNIVAKIDENGIQSVAFLDKDGNDIVEKLENMVNSTGESEGTSILKYELSSDGTHYTCTGFIDGVDADDIFLDIVIPAEYKGLPVTAISNSAFFGQYIKSCTLPSTITSIGANAFMQNPSMRYINIPIGVTTIGSGAFTYCSKLIIYCEATSAGSGWDSSWNGSNRPVYWGCEVASGNLNGAEIIPTATVAAYAGIAYSANEATHATISDSATHATISDSATNSNTAVVASQLEDANSKIWVSAYTDEEYTDTFDFSTRLTDGLWLICLSLNNSAVRVTGFYQRGTLRISTEFTTNATNTQVNIGGYICTVNGDVFTVTGAGSVKVDGAYATRIM